MAIHNEAKLGDIAKTVLMPGDPLRAKYVAENFLEDYKLVNQVRGILAYTGKYKGKEITVMASGMGIASIGIYSYELYKFYEVENIIRIGSCGAYAEEIDLMDIVLADKAYSTSNFAEDMSGEKCHISVATKELNDIILETAKEQNIKCIKTNITSTDVFDAYMVTPEDYVKRLPEEMHITCSEMESFALFHTAKVLQKKAACLLTVVDSNCKKQELTSEQRQKSLNDMIKLGLESAVKM